MSKRTIGVIEMSLMKSQLAMLIAERFSEEEIDANLELFERLMNEVGLNGELLSDISYVLIETAKDPARDTIKLLRVILDQCEELGMSPLTYMRQRGPLRGCDDVMSILTRHLEAEEAETEAAKVIPITAFRSQRRRRRRP